MTDEELRAIRERAERLIGEVSIACHMDVSAIDVRRLCDELFASRAEASALREALQAADNLLSIATPAYGHPTNRGVSGDVHRKVRAALGREVEHD